MLGTMVRRVTVKTLDAVVQRGRRSSRAPVRLFASGLDRARGLLGLDVVRRADPLPHWEERHPDQHMWKSDRNKLHKHRLDHGIIKEEGAADEAEAIEEPPIKVYFKRGCPHARAAMDLLREREVEFESHDVKGDEGTLSWLKIVTGQSTTPQIFIRGESIGGHAELRDLDQAGALLDRIGVPEDPPRVRLTVVHPEHSPFEGLADEWKGEAAPELEGDELIARVREVLDECRPLIQADGGDVELLDVTRDTVQVQLTGNCIGCPSAQATLHQGIERRLKARIPQIKAIAVPD